ncbi:MAG: cation:proton antiporter [Chloracidobacterium sp.]|nr:cation:proton antiporter [Chloracidobacterium sp.]
MDHLVLEMGLALGLIALAASLSYRLRFPIVPFLILIGMAVGPHGPKIGLLDFRFIQSAKLIEFMGRAGILFLLFYLGLEFSISRLIKSGRSIVFGGSIYIAINFAAGLGYAYLLGWPLKETLVIAGVTTISSSAIVAKVIFDLRRAANPETEMILGIIMFEDIFLAFYLSIISGIVLSGATSLGEALTSAALSLAFILGVIFVGLKATPLLNRVLRIPSNEVFLLVIFACLFLLAGFGETIHVAEAIGALLLGLVLSETEHSERIERMIVPFRDFFGAIFFFGFGLTIDPLGLGGAVWPALGAVALTIVGNIAAGMVAGRIANLSTAASLNTGLTIISRGEFSIIMAKLARAGNLAPTLQSFAALYVLIVAVLGPLLTKESDRVYDLITKLLGGLNRNWRGGHDAEERGTRIVNRGSRI